MWQTCLLTFIIVITNALTPCWRTSVWFERCRFHWIRKSRPSAINVRHSWRANICGSVPSSNNISTRTAFLPHLTFIFCHFCAVRFVLFIYLKSSFKVSHFSLAEMVDCYLRNCWSDFSWVCCKSLVGWGREHLVRFVWRSFHSTPSSVFLPLLRTYIATAEISCISIGAHFEISTKSNNVRTRGPRDTKF